MKNSYALALLLLSFPTWAATVTIGFTPARSGLSAEELVLSCILDAHKTIRVAAYSFTSQPIARALINAHKRGVDVQVVLDKSNRPRANQKFTAATFLVDYGVPVRINSHYAIMHNKFMVIDDQSIETGSFNYTSSAAKKNAENAIYIKGDTAIAQRYASEWRELWAEGE